MFVQTEVRPVGEFLRQLFHKPAAPVEPITKMSQAIRRGLELGIREDRTFYLYKNFRGQYEGCLYGIAAVGLGLHEAIAAFEAKQGFGRSEHLRQAVEAVVSAPRMVLRELEHQHYLGRTDALQAIAELEASGY